MQLKRSSKYFTFSNMISSSSFVIVLVASQFPVKKLAQTMERRKSWSCFDRDATPPLVTVRFICIFDHGSEYVYRNINLTPLGPKSRAVICNVSTTAVVYKLKGSTIFRKKNGSPMMAGS